MKSQSGFSLIELMVVVGIMGVLTSIAVPNYMVVVAKGRQAEAKAELATTYAAETAFMKEFATPTMCLYFVGDAPSEAHRRYSYGFLNGDGAIYGPSMNYNSTATCDFSTSLTTIDGTSNSATFSCSPGFCGGGSPANHWEVTSATAWTAGAWGEIMTGSGLTDVWQIDQDKNLVNLQSGL